MNSFYYRFDKHNFCFVIDDIIISTKTGGNLHIQEKLHKCAEKHWS